jgi:nicotinic acid mononucleotide adenylyltransferase
MKDEIRQIVQQIHDSSGRTVVVTAGAGTQAVAWLLGVAGASRTLLEALVPYEESSFNDFLGQKPAQYVSPETAGLLAGRAVNRAMQLWQGPEPVIGLACTATIVTDRPKRGEHRAHICAWTAEKIIHHSLHLHKGARDRKGEERLVSQLLINALAEAYGLEARVELALGEGDEHEYQRVGVEIPARHLLDGQADYISLAADGWLDGKPDGSAILSGAFNPLHPGHTALAEAAAGMLGVDVVFELTAVNADKPPLAEGELLRRLLQFAGRYPVLVSAAPTFQAKSRLFPGATFVVGYDTAARILQARFYGGQEALMLAALSEIREHGCSFLVAGRLDRQGDFHEAHELVIPEALQDLFQALPHDRFRYDVSSTEIRKRRDH